MRLDARIPVHVVSSGTTLPDADPQALLVVAEPSLLAGVAGGTGWMAVRQVAAEGLVAACHPVGCACCAARSPLALLLSSSFEQRARGTLGLFRCVWLMAPAALVEAVPALLASDPVVSGRYRIGEN